MKAISLAIKLLPIFFLHCSSSVSEPGPTDYESSLATISIDGKNDRKIAFYAISGYGGSSANLHWLGDKPQFLLCRNNIYLYNLDGEVLKQIQKPANINEVDVSPDGSLAVLACAGTIAELYLLNTMSYELKKITDTPDMVERFPRFSQDGRKIVYATLAGKSGKEPLALKMYDLISDSSSTLLVREKYNTDFLPFATPCFGKNDEIVYYIHNFTDTLSHNSPSKLYSLNLRSGEISLIDENATWPAFMKYAPIGDRLVYLANKPFWGIRVYDAANNLFFELGDKIRSECHAIGPNLILNINSSGTRVVAGTDYCSDAVLYSINIATSEYATICPGTSPALSRDGKTVIYVKTQLRGK